MEKQADEVTTLDAVELRILIEKTISERSHEGDRHGLPLDFFDNPNVTPRMLDRIAKNISSNHIDVAQHKQTAPETLKYLLSTTDHAGDDHFFIRICVSSHAALKTHMDLVIMILEASNGIDRMTMNTAVGILHRHHEPYKSWPLEWVESHFGITR